MRLFKRRHDELFRGSLELSQPQNWGRPDTDLTPDGKTICLILEGAYPYIPGGVSTWMQQFISGLKDYRFKILSIMASKDQKKELSYTFPENVIEFRTVYLNGFLDITRTHKKKITLTDTERSELRKFILFDQSVNWETITQVICSQERLGNPIDFLMSNLFFDELVTLYQEKFTNEGFTNFFWTIRSMLASLLSIMQQKLPEADLYHAISTGYAGLLGLLAKYTYTKPFVLTEHGVYAREREEEILKADWVKGNYKNVWIEYFYFLSCAAYQACDISVALFEQNSDIQKSLGVTEDRARVIPNGVDLREFSRDREPHPGMHIGAVLRVVPIKDVKTLIKAFYYINTQYKDTRLFIIGPEDEDKEYARECRTLVKELELDHAIEFTGRVDVKLIMKKIDVVVLTSISEAQPLVILEAFACGIPVVSSDVGSCRELVYGRGDSYGKGGIITKPVSPKETADALIHLYEYPEKREAFGRNGFERAKGLYSIEAIYHAYEELYAAVLARYARSPAREDP